MVAAGSTWVVFKVVVVQYVSVPSRAYSAATIGILLQ